MVDGDCIVPTNSYFRRDRGYRTLTDFEERDEQLLVLAVKGAVMHNLFENLDTVTKFISVLRFGNADFILNNQ